jgi:hypothetical protein
MNWHPSPILVWEIIKKINEKASEKALLNKVGKMCDEVCDEHFQGCSNISKVIVVGHPVVEI